MMPSPEVAARVKTLFVLQTTDNRAPPLPFYPVWAEYLRVRGGQLSSNTVNRTFSGVSFLRTDVYYENRSARSRYLFQQRRNRPGFPRLLLFTVFSKSARVRIAQLDTRGKPGLPRRWFSGPPRRNPTIGIPISMRTKSSNNFLISTSGKSWSRRRRTGLRLNRIP